MQVTTGISGIQGWTAVVPGATVHTPGRAGFGRFVDSVVEGGADDGATPAGAGGGVVTTTGVCATTSTGAGSAGFGITGLALSRYAVAIDTTAAT